MTSNDWLAVFGGLGLATLIPVIWAIVDVARRPAWQFSTGRKLLWGLTLGLGWLVLWPVALVSSVLYLAVLRRRFPGSPSSRPGSGQRPYGYDTSAGGYRPYGGTPHYGGPSAQGGPYGGPSAHGGPYGGGPYGREPQGGPYGQPQGSPPYGDYGYPPNATPGPPLPLPPAGWYPDPAGSDQQRWWDGRGWTGHLRRQPT